MPRRHRTGRHGEAAGSRRRFAPRIRQDIARKDGVAASFAIIGWICYIAAALLLSWVVGALIHNDMIARTVADVVASAPSTWPAGDRKAIYNRAREYNGRLDAQFGGRIPADAASETGPARETLDTAYMTTLSLDDTDLPHDARFVARRRRRAYLRHRIANRRPSHLFRTGRAFRRRARHAVHASW